MPAEPAARREDVTGFAGCTVDETFDPLSPEYLADPYAATAVPRVENDGGRNRHARAVIKGEVID